MLKTFALGAATAASVMAGVALDTAPAIAATAKFTVGGNVDFTNPASGDTTLKFRNATPVEGFDSAFTFMPGLKVNDLTLTGIAPTFNATSSPVFPFITGFQFKGNDAVLNLNAGENLVKAAIGANGGGTFSTDLPLIGTIRRVGSNDLLANFTASIAAVETPLNNNFSFDVDATEIPTPALLPGLVGIGVATLRKRKAEASNSVDA